MVIYQGRIRNTSPTKEIQAIQRILDELDEIIAPDPGGQHQDSFSWRFCFHGRMSFSFVVHISLIYLESTAIVHEKNDLPSPKFHILIVVGFVVEVHFDAPIKMNKIFGQPSLGKKW